MHTAWTARVTLRHAATRPQVVRLREPRGSDELAVAGVDTRAGVQWLEPLLEQAPCRASELSASDRDVLFASLHRSLWGDRITAAIRCDACDAMYDLSFELSALQRQLHDHTRTTHVDASRTLVDARNGFRLRLPSADDEEMAAQSGIEAGSAQLVAGMTDGDAQDIEALSHTLEACAPLLDVDLDAQCAECDNAQVVRFDIQSFLLQRLLDERETVLDEVHVLASGYGWSLQEIGALPRSLRRALAERWAAASSPWG